MRSDIGSYKSVKSRISNVSARTSKPGAACPAISLEQPLEKIEEADAENAVAVSAADPAPKCELCPTEIVAEDMAMNDEINRNLGDEIRTQAAYILFRKKKGLAAVDFAAEVNPHKV